MWLVRTKQSFLLSTSVEKYPSNQYFQLLFLGQFFHLRHVIITNNKLKQFRERVAQNLQFHWINSKLNDQLIKLITNHWFQLHELVIIINHLNIARSKYPCDS